MRWRGRSPISSTRRAAGWMTRGRGTAGLADGYLKLPGGSGNYADSPDHADFDITGDIDIAVEVAMDDWTPAVQSSLISKYLTTGNQRSWDFHVATDGRLRLQSWVTGGGSAVSNVTTIIPLFVDGGWYWVRVTLDVDDGAGNRVAKFYTSPPGPTPSWTLLQTVTTAGATSIFSGSALPNLGARNAGGEQILAGKIHRLRIRDGFDGAGTLKCSLDLTNNDGEATQADTQGHVWTERGTAEFVAVA